MKPSWKPLLAALCLALLAAPAVAQVASPRAYAPENLRSLPYDDQVRVISLEYREQSRGRRIPDDQLRFYLDQVNRSNWGFSRIKADIAQSLRGSDGPYPGSPGYPGGPGNGRTVLCESRDDASRRCRVPWRGPTRLVRQLSRSPCIQDRSWGWREGEVTVWNGCRAEFASARDGGYSVTCSSNDGRTTTCAWDARQGRPRLIQQLSRNACVQGRTWGQLGRSTIWVSGGCRGRFGVD